MKTKKQIIILGLLLMLGTICQAEIGEIQMTFSVADDSGKPIGEASVGISFIQSKSLAPITAYDLSKKQIDAVTDTNGQVVIKGSSVFDSHVYYSVKTLPGYYSDGNVEYRFLNIKNGQWQPWNPTVNLVLRPIVNPVPMYAQKAESFIPTTGKRYGYDLMIGDLVAPDGKGQVADIYFNVTGYWKTFNDYDSTLVVSFANPQDGIQTFDPINGSSFRSPREAPLDGYQAELELHRVHKSGQSSSEWIDNNKSETDYFFRVRTVLDENGKIKSALYGKIYGGIKFGGAVEHCYVDMKPYYLNPEPNSRNMEFDPKQNMFKKLDILEQVFEP
jgi:hypothetical protein